MSLVHLIAGARPNFVKIAPIARAIQKHSALSFRIVNTGQHYDHEMNEIFFEELGIPRPDVNLAVGGGSHAKQTARIMVAYEEYCELEKPDAVIVVGDVNSTLACAIVAKKLCIPVAHVEAGLRSGDISMPEEVNRIVTDSISDWFFATEPSGVENLRMEGKPGSAVHYVGQVMVDNLLYQVDKLPQSGVHNSDGLVTLKQSLISQSKRYGVVTLHRPSNVDSPETLGGIVAALEIIAEDLPLIFPVHPRTHANMLRFGIKLGPRISAIEPQGYMAFLALWMDAALVLTDSGGLQEETTALGVPCLTLRDNTERPITVDEGTNILVGTDPRRILPEAHKILRGQGKVGQRPRFWDGRAAERIVQILEKELS